MRVTIYWSVTNATAEGGPDGCLAWSMGQQTHNCLHAQNLRGFAASQSAALMLAQYMGLCYSPAGLMAAC